ncbi:MAG: hypothetical protein HW416_3207 [Chloroflexi bacterium]|nr:hypothetical protein [Chloroflexota bacterium]
MVLSPWGLSLSLYPAARVTLSRTEVAAIDEWEAQAATAAAAGANVVENLHNDSHLVGDPPRPGSVALGDLLRGIASGSPSAPDSCFESAAERHLNQGRHLSDPPDTVYRFRPADSFGRVVAMSSGDPLDITRFRMDPQRYVEDLVDYWEIYGRPRVAATELGGRPAVFVTFPTGGRLVSDAFHRAREIVDALGFPPQADQPVVRLTYSADDVRPLRYPTVADGGWNEHFAAAPAGAPHGWTRPTSRTGIGWPEAVHANRLADVVRGRPTIYAGP